MNTLRSKLLRTPEICMRSGWIACVSIVLLSGCGGPTTDVLYYIEPLEVAEDQVAVVGGDVQQIDFHPIQLSTLKSKSRKQIRIQPGRRDIFLSKGSNWIRSVFLLEPAHTYRLTITNDPWKGPGLRMINETDGRESHYFFRYRIYCDADGNPLEQDRGAFAP